MLTGEREGTFAMATGPGAGVNTPQADPRGNVYEVPACRIFQMMQLYLSSELNTTLTLAEVAASRELAGAAALGLSREDFAEALLEDIANGDLIHAVELGSAKNAKMLRIDCPDNWKTGKLKQITEENLVDNKVLYKDLTAVDPKTNEVVFLGKLDFGSICICPPPEPCKETFLVSTFPSLKVHEIPYMIWSGAILDDPPVAPEVEIVPYKGVNNKLLFKIGAGIGDYYDVPIGLNSSYERYFQDIQRRYRDLGRIDDKIRFRSDDPVVQFKMYRMTRKPVSYLDFGHAVGTEVKDFFTGPNVARDIAALQREGDNDMLAMRIYGINRNPFSPENIIDPQTDAVSTIETLEPNKKYYYVFQAFDYHGHPSNPTAIYEVEIVDTDGAIYPLINIYDPNPELPLDLSKQGQRLLQIRPEYLQSVIDMQGSGFSDSQGKPTTESAGTPGGLPAKGFLKLGARDEKLWNKKFKLRLTSCETRRMLDINLKFKVEHQSFEACPPIEGLLGSDDDYITLPQDLADLIPGGEENPDSPFGTIIQSLVKMVVQLAAEPDFDPEEMRAIINAIRALLGPGGAPLNRPANELLNRLMEISGLGAIRVDAPR